MKRTNPPRSRSDSSRSGPSQSGPSRSGSRSGSQTGSQAGGPAHRSKARPWTIPAEWITFGIAATIVAGLIGLILLTWVLQKDEPPQLALIREPVEQRQNQFYVPFTVENRGGGTAESVQVLAELRQGERLLESGEQQIDFLSSGEQEEGAFVFSRNPDRYELELRVASYKLP